MAESSRLAGLQRVLYSFLLAANILLLLAFSGAVYGANVYVPGFEPGATVTVPPIFLQSGTADSSTIYANNTSARVNTAAPAPIPTYYPSESSGQNWWDSHYSYRRKMTIINNDVSDSIPVRFTVNFTIDTQELVTDGKLQADGDDFRIVWWNSSSSSSLELDRLNTTSFNTASTTIKFRTQTSISAGSFDSNYCIYYGYSGATDPPTNGNNAYLFEDLFNRADSSTVGLGWVEYDGIAGSNARILSNKLNLLSANGVYDTQAYHTLSGFSNRSVWEFQWDFSRTGAESIYSMWMQLGKYSSMSNTSNTAGASVYLDWTGTGAARGPAASAHEMLRVWNGGSVTEIQVLSGSHIIKLDMDLTAGSFTIYVDGSNKGTYAVYQKLQSYDCIRFVFEQATPANFGSYNIDNTRTYLTAGTDPSVSINQEQYFFGSYVSGTIPTSVQTVDSNYFVVQSAGSATSTTAYNPSSYNLIGSTTLISGTTADLPSNNGGYMTFRSYASATSSQILYQHQDMTSIGGSSYYLQKLTSADASGTSLSASMSSTGRQILGTSVYPLSGVTSIPASTWTTYYRAWQSSGPSIAYDAAGSGNNGAGSASVSWNHTTGSGYNRVMIVGVSIRTPTVSVSSITYGAQSLSFIRADTRTTYVRSELWYLVAPASGTATVTVTLSGTSRATGGSCTYTGVAQSSPIEANNGGNGKSGTPSASVTVNTANSWLLGHVAITGDGKIVSSEGSGQTMRWNQVTTGGVAADRNQGHGSDKGPVGTGSQSMSWDLSGAEDYAVSIAAFKPASPAVGHLDVDILIRQSDGTVRTAIATNVANSANLSSTASTLSGTYSWATYTVVSQTDYLEIDYYVEVATAQAGMSAYLRIDDNTLATSNQTRTINVYLPSEFTSEVEFTGLSDTASWYQLVWNIDSGWNTSSVSVTIQVYNYTSGGYPTSGNGYNSYTSSGTANTDETKTQTITTNPTSFRNGTGYWKIKVKGVKTTTTQFDFKADWVEFKPSYYNEYTVSTEFLFSSMTKSTPTQLNFTVVSEYDVASVSVTIQVWNYSSSSYVTSGQGYQTYTSSGFNETKLLSISINPQFYTSGGNAKIKVTGVLSTTAQYQQKANQVKLVHSHSSSPNYDYVLKITNQDSSAWKIRLNVYSDANIVRLNNCTIYFHNASDGTSRQIYIQNGAYVNQTGPWYDLPASPAERYIAITLDASSEGESYVYVYLEILIPDKTIYARYILTFEVT